MRDCIWHLDSETAWPHSTGCPSWPQRAASGAYIHGQFPSGSIGSWELIDSRVTLLPWRWVIHLNREGELLCVSLRSYVYLAWVLRLSCRVLAACARTPAHPQIKQSGSHLLVKCVWNDIKRFWDCNWWYTIDGSNHMCQTQKPDVAWDQQIFFYAARLKQIVHRLHVPRWTNRPKITNCLYF